MDGYQRRTAMKKEKIRHAALELFSAHGVNKTTVTEVAEKAGVTPTTIYNYFQNKEGLTKDTIIHFIEKQWEFLQEMWTRNLPFPELIEQVTFQRDAVSDKLNMDLLNSLVNNDPDIRQWVNDFYKNRFPDMIDRFVEKGRREGFISKTYSNETIMLYLQMYREMAHRPEVLTDGNKQLIKELHCLMLYGLIGQPVTDPN